MDSVWKPGQQIVWIRVTRGHGFGFAERVSGIVIRLTLKRVEIEVRERDGQLAHHKVSPGRLQAAD
jgi:hypothetical protein